MPDSAGWVLRRVREQRWTIVSIAVLVPLGLYTKAYRGPADAWINASLGGAFYVVFWCLVARCLLPKCGAARIAATVLLATCCVEFLQLWHPPFLEALRRHFVGRMILGTTFDWSDFPYYFAGAGAGWLWLRALGERVSGGLATRRRLPTCPTDAVRHP